MKLSTVRRRKLSNLPLDLRQRQQVIRDRMPRGAIIISVEERITTTITTIVRCRGLKGEGLGRQHREKRRIDATVYFKLPAGDLVDEK